MAVSIYLHLSHIISLAKEIIFLFENAQPHYVLGQGNNVTVSIYFLLSSTCLTLPLMCKEAYPTISKSLHGINLLLK
jgi:hypothetical protein